MINASQVFSGAPTEGQSVPLLLFVFAAEIALDELRRVDELRREG